MPTIQANEFEICEDVPQDALSDCLTVFNATRENVSSTERFDWLYRQNPDGDAVVWTIRKSESSDAIGFTVALPRRMLVDGVERNCWIGSDFSVLRKYRTLGLALKLRRAAKDGIDDGRADFLYAHPNDRMAVIHQRVGHRPVGAMVRLAKPLRLGSYISEATSSRKLGAVAGAVLDPMKRLMDSAARAEKQYSVQHCAEARFDERFDELFSESMQGWKGVIGIRDARYLNWRYRDNPLYETEMLTLQKGDRLVGYALFVIDGNTAHVKDIFPAHETAMALSLLTALVRTGYEKGWQSISVGLLETNPLLPILERLGFRRRAETSQMFAYCPEARPYSTTIMDGRRWLLTVGDRDV